MKARNLLIIVLDGILLFSFFIQSLLIGCLIIYGHIPVSAKWANQQLLERRSDGFHIQAKSFRLKLWQKIELIDLKIYHNEIKNPLLEAVSAEIHYSVHTDKERPFSLNELVLTNGALIMPAVYAPDGKRTTVLENLSLHLSLTRQEIRIDSLAAKHEDIYLRGSIEWPVSTQRKKEKTSIEQFYQLLATAIKEKATFSPFIQPTLEFALSAGWDRLIDVSLTLSCKQLKHSGISGSYFSLSTDFVFDENALTTQSPLLLSAREMTFAKPEVFAENVTAYIKPDKWPGIFEGILPQFEISSHRLTTYGIELHAPQITIEPSAFPVLRFSGTTCGLDGSARFSGVFNSNDRSGKIKANGGINIFDLLPDPLVSQLPELTFGSTPFYNLSVLLDKEFEIINASFYANFKNLTADELHFDNIITAGYYCEDTLNFETIHVDRRDQWVDGTFQMNTLTQDFRIFLLGSILPKQYNPLLPKWWSDIFEDLSFDPETPGYGDFAVYCSMKKNGETSLFGQAQANNLKYKDASFDACQLIVRSRRNYVEIDDIDARAGGGRATGKLGITSARRPQKGLVSVRYNFNGSLPVEVISKSLGGEIADVLDSFELAELPDVQVDGVVFNEKFQEYADKSSVNLQAKVNAPLTFKDTPLDYLNFKLFGQDSNTHLREVQFGYAGGAANAMIDILNTEDAKEQICFKLNLKNANQAKAIQHLPSLKDGKQQTTPDNQDAARISGQVDLNLHAKGPLSDAYGFEGYGDLEVRNKKLGAIQLLGPLSELLKNTFFNFTSFNLDRMNAVFTVDREKLRISKLEINGPRTRISADGTLQLTDQALDMDVNVNLFANVGRSDSIINTAGRFLVSPLPNLLSFTLTGTVQDQKVRSRLDPRNLIQ